jgi:hypothetical protein
MQLSSILWLMLDADYLLKIQTKNLADYATNREFVRADELLDMFASDRQDGSRWIFRGQPDKALKLEPTIRRRTARLGIDGITTGPTSETEKFLVEEFQ